MALADWLIAIVVLVSVLSAAKTGLIVEVFSLAGVVLGLLLASWNYEKLLPWVAGWIHSLPAAEAVAFLLIAIGVMIVAALAGRIVRWSVRSIGLGWADRLAGAAFGFVKGCLLVTLAVMVAAAFWPKTTWFQSSRLAPYFLSMARQTTMVTPSDLGERIQKGVETIRSAQPEWLRPPA
ncbi:CvpA family protein [Paracidobacterium acidisoli]|uniref:CvpA family protein n=1 Tax=Paracidobacterium acidisoli TaxID=2303751 RepID=A0A372ITZ7_9BACT|nr:CvpA family protein [Paracidobacterium acidisoli]MBT9329856.1 CvpA family protein [Paracidobacterium acidisoli]